MKRPIIAIALSLADKNWRLRDKNARLERDLALALATVRKRTDEREQARRDVELLLLCAKDRAAAYELVETAHDVNALREVGGG